MEDIIQIKCPFDGAVLSVRNQPGIENKNVTCPICRHRYPFKDFVRVMPAADVDEPDTEYPGSRRNDSGSGHVAAGLPSANMTVGRFKAEDSGIIFALKYGRNIIGRKGMKSQADIQIDTDGSRAMSREHVVVEVRKDDAKGIVHCVSLYKGKVNETYVGQDRLEYGDLVILNDGDFLKLPGVTLRFEIPDDEATDYHIPGHEV